MTVICMFLSPVMGEKVMQAWINTWLMLSLCNGAWIILGPNDLAGCRQLTELDKLPSKSSSFISLFSGATLYKHWSLESQRAKGLHAPPPTHTFLSYSTYFFNFLFVTNQTAARMISLPTLSLGTNLLMTNYPLGARASVIYIFYCL